MNVLIYSGHEVLQPALSSCVNSLRSLLVSNYAVQSISQHSLTAHPWADNCALLVFPSCHKDLSSPSVRARIQSYIENGGAVLAFGAQVRTQPPPSRSSETLEGRIERMSLNEEQFSHSTSGSAVDIVFGIGSEPSRLGKIKSAEGHTSYVLRPPRSDPQKATNTTAIQSIAHYLEDDQEAGIAAVQCSFNRGGAILWDSLADHPLTDEPAITLWGQTTPATSQEDITIAEEQRHQLLRSSLRQLGLVVPEQKSAAVSPLPQFLTGIPSKTWVVDKVLQALSIEDLKSGVSSLRDSNDVVMVCAADWSMMEYARHRAAERADPAFWQPKVVLACRDGLVPPNSQTPLFDISKFYDELTRGRGKPKSSSPAEYWGIGEALMYGEVVTSTQTMLDKNPRILSLLPAPLLSLASHQLAGRGRGGNIWLSPSGCLQFSLLLRVSLSQLPVPRLVFIQYLFGLAVVQACRDKAILGTEGHRIRLKWPNDIYAVRADGEWKKIGGILVSTSFSSGQVEIVIGCGLNVWNPPPIQSLIQLIPAESDLQLSMERTAATIMLKFEDMWHTFLEHRGSFEPFIDLYYDRWLHSDQLVELTTTTPHQKVRIVGITSDHGLLRTMPESDGWSGLNGGSFIDLQPDGNSFDLMAGLIKAKS